MKTLMRLGAKRIGFPALLAALAMILLLGAGAQPALAQDAKLDLSNLDKLASKATEVTNVNLEGPMIQMAAEMMAKKAQAHVKSPGSDAAVDEWAQKMEKAQQLSEMLKRLKGIYVRTYEFSKTGQYSRSDVEGILKQLQSGGWKPMVNVEEKKSGETTNIYAMDEGGEAVGMAIVVAEPDELTVVNIVGPIDFSMLGGLAGMGNAVASGLSGFGAAAAPKLDHRDSSGDHAGQQKPNNQGDSK